MSLAIKPLGSSALEIDVHGKLEKEDYKKFVPLAEERIQRQGQIALLIRLSDFKGWTVSALWEDLKFDVRHYRDVSRLALVGKEPSKKWMATLSKPFTAAQVEYYPESQIDTARAWVQNAPIGSAAI